MFALENLADPGVDELSAFGVRVAKPLDHLRVVRVGGTEQVDDLLIQLRAQLRGNGLALHFVHPPEGFAVLFRETGEGHRLEEVGHRPSGGLDGAGDLPHHAFGGCCAEE